MKNMKLNIPEQWREILSAHTESSSYKELVHFVNDQYHEKVVFPARKDIFAALEKTEFTSIKVIILGQDPYHNPGQAQGLSFSVPMGAKLPPSLKNIYKEIQRSTGISKNMNEGDLGFWAQQGVLMLNVVLTVEKNKPGSHANHGWEDFTDYIIQRISKDTEHCVFLLWGNYAQKKKEYIDESKHLVLSSAHPSPLSAYKGFFGNNHFALTNEYLQKYGKTAIEW